MSVTSPGQGGTRKKSSLGRLALGCGGLIGVVVLVVAAWFLYDMVQSTRLLASARANREAGNYAAAVQELQTLQSDYGSFDAADEARDMLPQVRLEWAEALRDEGAYAEALLRYDEVASLALADAIAQGKQQTRLEWGQALLQEEEFAQAQEQFDLVLAEAQEGSPIYNEARAALPDVYVGLAEAALAEGDVTRAFANLSTVFRDYQSGEGREKALASFRAMVEPLYAVAQQQRSSSNYAQAEPMLVAIANHAPDNPLAAQVQSELPAFYFEWGNALFAAEQFEAAVDVYKHLLDTYPESEFAAQANTGLIDAQVAAISQSGAAGALPAPQASGGSGDASTVTYEVENDTECPIVVLMSGPQSQALRLAASSTNEVELEAGLYNLVVQTDEEAGLSEHCQDIIPFTGESTFESGTIYRSSFYIETTTE